MEEKSDFEWFNLRTIGTTYVSKKFDDKLTKDTLRVLHRVFKLDQHSKIEKDINSNLIILTTKNDKIQLKVFLYEKENVFKEIILQRFSKDKPDGASFSFKNTEFSELLKVLHTIKFIDFNNPANFKVYDKGETVILEGSKEKEIIDFLSSSQNKNDIIKILKRQKFTKEDLDILQGRREALELFHTNLFEKSDWDEKNWQVFFEQNTWIFGYGLSYRFLQILQREASISTVDIDGKNEVKADYLMADHRFTVIVELKRPDTPLLKNSQGRSDTWRLSNDLIDSVSQILAQKANWILKGNSVDNFLENDERIDQNTFDPKAILIIGRIDQFNKTDRIEKIKLKTFELFRRDSKNIEILTFNELYERAFYLVNQQPQ